MKRSCFSYLLLALCLAVLPGCEQPDGGSVDSGGSVPVVSDGTLSPDTLNVDTLTASNGIYTIRSTVTVKASDPDGDLSAVVARVLQHNSSDVLLEMILHDDGAAPDSTAGDSVYSGSVEFPIIRAEAGPYRVQLYGSDGNDLRSSILDLELATTRSNSPPVLDSTSLSAPSLITVPVGGVVGLSMSIAAADSDGLADIRSVYFLSPDGGNPDFRFPLTDDGQGSDVVAGDGTFSIDLIVADSPTIRGTYRLLFKAEDSFGDTSNTVLHTLTIE